MNQVPAHILQAVILTKNEEPNIERVLQKLTWLEKVVVIDSYSDDSTLAICQSFPNTEVYQRAFDTHATQWNYGVDKANSQWILSLDADYVLPDDFIAETVSKLSLTEIAAFDAQFHFLVFGEPLRGNNTTPRPVLFQKSMCRYFDDGHTQRLKISGLTGKYAAKINHDDRKSLTRWLTNQASYSLKECNMLLETPNEQLAFSSKVRKTKIWAPFMVFFYCLFVKGLLFDGWKGWYYTLQRTTVEILLMLRMIERTKAGMPDAQLQKMGYSKQP